MAQFGIRITKTWSEPRLQARRDLFIGARWKLSTILMKIIGEQLWATTTGPITGLGAIKCVRVHKYCQLARAQQSDRRAEDRAEPKEPGLIATVTAVAELPEETSYATVINGDWVTFTIGRTIGWSVAQSISRDASERRLAWLIKRWQYGTYGCNQNEDGLLGCARNIGTPPARPMSPIIIL